MPPDHVILFKLVWHPDNFEDGQLKPTAFTSKDLSGEPDDHISVDRSDMAARATMENIAIKQHSKADGKTLFREFALIGRLHCGSVRAIDFQGAAALAVEAVPVPGNDAHCGISNITRHKSRSYLAEIRGKLARLASPPASFDEAYGEAS